VRTAVLIPCYNEALTIEKVVKDYQSVLPEAEVYVYDNNSTDGTAKIAEKAGAIVRHEYKQGKGNVIRSMFRDIEADCYIMADGDDTYPAEFAIELQNVIKEGRGDMAIGDRLSSTYFEVNKRPFHNFGNDLVRKIINQLYHSNVKDIMTGSRAFSRDFVKSFPVLSKGFEVETEMTIFALDANFKIVEVPIEYRDRPEGSESKLNTYSDGFKVLMTIFNLFRETKPGAFFSILGTLFLAISVGFFIPIMVDFSRTGVVERYPTLIIISAIGVAAMVLYACGIILAVLRKQHRENFERSLNMQRSIKQLMKEKHEEN